MDGPEERPLVNSDVNDSDWPMIQSNTYWAEWFTDFTLRTHFAVPLERDAQLPVALHLPLGVVGNFSHPEALVYIDGEPFAGCDRHHQETLLRSNWLDGRPHLLALHGWTGRGGWQNHDQGTRPLMGQCSLVQIDVPTRNFIKTARIALGVANAIDEDDPAHGWLLNVLTRLLTISTCTSRSVKAFTKAYRLLTNCYKRESPMPDRR